MIHYLCFNVCLKIFTKGFDEEYVDFLPYTFYVYLSLTCMAVVYTLQYITGLYLVNIITIW